MQKDYQTFIGIDVSKSKLDYCILVKGSSGPLNFGVIDNNARSITRFINTLKKQNICNEQALFCLEHTGVYGMPLCYLLQATNLDYQAVVALEIKRSKGIVRGKSDKADARDIAYYAVTHCHQIKLSKIPEGDLIELRLFLAEREKLIKSIAVFTATNEHNGFLPKELLKDISKHNQKTISFLKKQLKNIDDLINDIIKRNETFKLQDELLQSIPGVGRQTSVTFTAYTQHLRCLKVTANLPALQELHPLNLHQDQV